jgi:hypothetical protein
MSPLLAALCANAGSASYRRSEPLPHGIIATLDRLAGHLRSGPEREPAAARGLSLTVHRETDQEAIDRSVRNNRGDGKNPAAPRTSMGGGLPAPGDAATERGNCE